jgi:hypothetical protein
LLGVSRNVVRTLLKRYGLIADGGDAESVLNPEIGLGRPVERAEAFARCN